jgi:uncharacterized protein (TIGR02594 family)
MNFAQFLEAIAALFQPKAKLPPAAQLPWMAVAETYLGVSEIKGAKHNPDVVEMFALSGFSGIKDDETPWCAAFVGGVLHRVGLGRRDGITLAARSFEKYGTGLSAPAYGAIGVKKRSGGASWQGHVGFVVGANATHVFLLGGNQGDKVSIASFRRSEFTAFRWPSGVAKANIPLPETIEGAKSATEA